MLQIQEKYIIDEKGNRTAVVIDIKDYNKIKDLLLEYEEYDVLDINKDIAMALNEVKQGQVKPINELLEDL